MTCITSRAGNRHTARHHRRESPALESARQNRYTNPLHTASADRRHSFAVHTLLDWYRAGEDIDRRMPLLSTFMGHTDPASTYWYLEAVPELLELVSLRLEQFPGILS
jgi:integrase